jgi:hypothetical protein
MAPLAKSCWTGLLFSALAIIVVPGLANAASSWSWSWSSPSPYSYVNYSAVTGYFLQDLDSTDANTFDYVRNPLFPLILGSHERVTEGKKREIEERTNWNANIRERERKYQLLPF